MTILQESQVANETEAFGTQRYQFRSVLRDSTIAESIKISYLVDYLNSVQKEYMTSERRYELYDLDCARRFVRLEMDYLADEVRGYSASSLEDIQADLESYLHDDTATLILESGFSPFPRALSLTLADEVAKVI